MGTPYITPDILTQAPNGISWKTIPAQGATPVQQSAEITRICWRATHLADSICNQPLRATLDTEALTGPDGWRLTQNINNLTGEFLPSRWPVINVVAGQVANASGIPYQWNTIPLSAIDVSGGSNPDPDLSFDPNEAGAGAFRIIIAPGYVSWNNGRAGTRCQMSYLNGWPHTSLISAAPAGSTTLTVDDVTGWAGLNGSILDEPNDEQIQCISDAAVSPSITPAPTSNSVNTGPGTLTLASPTIYGHNIGTLVTTMPYSIQQAIIYLGAYSAILRGATSFTVGELRPRRSSSTQNANPWYQLALDILAPYARVI